MKIYSKILLLVFLFYEIPDQLISESEALMIAREILATEPTSKAALEVLEEINNNR